MRATASVSSWTFVFCLGLFSLDSTAVLADTKNPTAAEVARAEEDWAKAQQDYYEAMKREPRASQERLNQLRQEHLGSKEQALNELHRNFQLQQRPGSSPPRAGQTGMPAGTSIRADEPSPGASPGTAPAGPIADEPALPPPDSVTTQNFGKKPAPAPTSRFEIEEVTSTDSATTFKSKPAPKRPLKK